MAALDHPAMPPEPVASLDAAPDNPRPDPARPALLPPHLGIVGLVGVQRVGAPAQASSPPAAQRRDRVQRRGHRRAVVAVGTDQNEAERRAARVGDEVAPGPRLAPIRRVRAGGRPPFLAGTLAPSTLARLPSISPATYRPLAGRLPVAQSAPATHAAAARHLGRQPLPGDARAQHEQDARQGSPIVHPGTPAPRAERVRRQKGGDRSPEIVGEKRASHNNPTPARPARAGLVGALEDAGRAALNAPPASSRPPWPRRRAAPAG